MSKISSLVTIVLFAFFLSAFSAKKIQAQQARKYKVSQQLSDCWLPELLQGVRPKGETDVSKIPIRLNLACRTKENSFGGVVYELEINKCLFDSLNVMNLNKKRYRECIDYQFIPNRPYVFKAVCRNLGSGNPEWVEVDLNKYYKVTDGKPSCSVRK